MNAQPNTNIKVAVYNTLGSNDPHEQAARRHIKNEVRAKRVVFLGKLPLRPGRPIFLSAHEFMEKEPELRRLCVDHLVVLRLDGKPIHIDTAMALCRGDKMENKMPHSGHSFVLDPINRSGHRTVVLSTGPVTLPCTPTVVDENNTAALTRSDDTRDLLAALDFDLPDLESLVKQVVTTQQSEPTKQQAPPTPRTYDVLDSNLLTHQEACAFLGVSDDVLREMITEHNIAVRVVADQERLHINDLLKVQVMR